MSNSYKNIIKNFAHKLNEQNEQQMPVQQHEEKVNLTQAKAKHFDLDTRRANPNATPPATVELDNGKKLKFVSSLADQVKGKVDDPVDYEFISVYVDDSNKKYLVYDYDEFDMGPIADLAMRSWIKRFESGALTPNVIDPALWVEIINRSNLLGFLGYNAAETIAKAISSLKLDAKQAKRTVEALWGNSNYSFKDIIKEIVSMNGEFVSSFLTSDPNGFHDIKGYEDKPIGAMRYEFEV